VRKGLSSLRITSLPGRHAPGPAQQLLPPVMGSLLEFQEGPDAPVLRIYVSGDTLMVPELQRIKDTYPDLDASVVHLGGTKVLGLLVTMDGMQGANFLELFRPKVAVPVHYDDYTVFRSPLEDFRTEMERRQLPIEVRYVRHGDTVSLRP
jgi:L-ascorbate metabolism protein UlaG (beta-lactamase superfamily)